MPPGGRPPGARLWKKSRGWESQQSWEDRRFEELVDNDEGDGEGVYLDPAYAQNRFVSDELYFDGIDVGPSRRRRGNNVSEEDSEYIDDETYNRAPNGTDGWNMQVMLREKEDFLVERALERIRRARMLGKTNVKLSQAEIDALERAERNQQRQSAAPKAPRSKKPPQTKPRAEERRGSKGKKSPPTSVPPKVLEPRRRGRSSTGRREDASPVSPPYPILSHETYGSASGALPHAPQSYYAQANPQQSSSSSRPTSRRRSSQSLRQKQQHTPPPPQYQHPYSQTRYFSNPDYPYAAGPSRTSTLRTDPTDPSWEPRARSTSNLVPYPADQHGYPAYYAQGPPPMYFDARDPRFAIPQARRMASGPPDVYAGSPMYGRSQEELFLRNEDDPRMMGRAYPQQMDTSGDGTTTTDEDEDGEQGVQVQVEVTARPNGEYGVQTRSSSGAAAGSRGRGGDHGQTKSVARRR